MASGHSFPQINLSVKGETQGGPHSGAKRVSNPEFRVGSKFRIIPEQYFSENVSEFLENIDNNLTYYEIPTHLACTYLKSHLTRRALDWFDVLGYRVVEDKATDYAHLKQAVTEQFPLVRNRSELETCFYASYQNHSQKLSDFVYELLKVHKQLQLGIREEKLLDHVISRLEPQLLDYVEVRHPQTTSSLLQIIDKYEERFLSRRIRGSSQEFRDANQSASNRFPKRNRQENWRETRVNNRYSDKADHRRSSTENPPDTEQRTIRISSLRMTPVELPYVPILLNETFITALWDTEAEKSFISEEVYRRYFSYRPRQKTKDRVVSAQVVLLLRSGRIADSDPRFPENLGISHS
ncbi:uncharacterized protein TNCV_814701 [Trichonephila clavipes]|nr:uncharacterized protein TNCV_814701 [Trichonephila clavipes]